MTVHSYTPDSVHTLSVRIIDCQAVARRCAELLNMPPEQYRAWLRAQDWNGPNPDARPLPPSPAVVASTFTTRQALQLFTEAVWNDHRLPDDLRSDLAALYHNTVLPILRNELGRILSGVETAHESSEERRARDLISAQGRFTVVALACDDDDNQSRLFVDHVEAPNPEAAAELILKERSLDPNLDTIVFPGLLTSFT
jgi:hypothetical protein